MLRDVIKYSGLNAKIKAIESNLLRYEDFYALANQSDVSGFANKLSESNSYSAILKELLQYNLGTRMPIERNLAQSMYKDFSKIYNFLTDINEKKYMDTLFLKYEINLIKTLIRRIFDKRESQMLLQIYGDFVLKHSSVNIQGLTESKTLDQFIEHLKGTKFYKVLEKIDMKTHTLFEFEQALDLFYYTQTWKAQYKYLSKKNQKIIEKINGADIDLNNIMHIYRYKKFYSIDKSIIYTYLLPVNYKIKKLQIEKLVNSTNDLEFKEVLKSTPYRNVFSNLQDASMELDYSIYMQKLYNQESHKNPYSIIPTICYFYKKNIELSNLTTLIEYVRYERDPEDSMKKLNIESKRVVN